MGRRNFIKNSLITTGGLLIGAAAIQQLIGESQTVENALPSAIQSMHRGHGKKVLVLMSAGTRRGNTDRLTDAYIKGLVERDHSVTKVYLGSMRIEGCRGCGACQRLARQCAVQDGMQEIYPLFAECDTIVLASPLYFWTITAKLKAVIERLYAISVDDKYPSKETVLLMTAGDDKENTFDEPKRYFHIISEIFGGKERGIYCAGGCTGCEKSARKIDKKHLENSYKLGLEL